MDENAVVTPDDQPNEPDKDWAARPIEGHPLNDTQVEHVVAPEETELDEVPDHEELTSDKENVFEQQGQKDLTTVAKEVLNGDWGQGVQRRQALADAGYDPNEVQEAVVEVLNNRP